VYCQLVVKRCRYVAASQPSVVVPKHARYLSSTDVLQQDCTTRAIDSVVDKVRIAADYHCRIAVQEQSATAGLVCGIDGIAMKCTVHNADMKSTAIAFV
jgi:hypothetical protein